MSSRILDPQMIANIYDVVDKKILETFAWLEASLINQVKEGIIEFHRDLWSLSIPI